MEGQATRLMQLAKHGDREAFDELVTGLRGRAFQVARSLVGTPEDALELTQETFLKVYKARERFRDGDPFLPWFHRILRNTCFSFLRERKRVRSLSDRGPEFDEDVGDFEIEDLAHGPSETALSGERARAFWVALETLSARDREMLALRHFKDLSYREIAHTLAIPEGTVMSRLFHARKRLGAALDPSAFPPEEFDLGGGGKR